MTTINDAEKHPQNYHTVNDAGTSSRRDSRFVLWPSGVTIALLRASSRGTHRLSRVRPSLFHFTGCRLPHALLPHAARTRASTSFPGKSPFFSPSFSLALSLVAFYFPFPPRFPIELSSSLDAQCYVTAGGVQREKKK